MEHCSAPLLIHISWVPWIVSSVHLYLLSPKSVTFSHSSGPIGRMIVMIWKRCRSSSVKYFPPRTRGFARRGEGDEDMVVMSKCLIWVAVWSMDGGGGVVVSEGGNSSFGEIMMFIGCNCVRRITDDTEWFIFKFVSRHKKWYGFFCQTVFLCIRCQIDTEIGYEIFYLYVLCLCNIRVSPNREIKFGQTRIMSTPFWPQIKRPISKKLNWRCHV